ncbi:MAG: hypothetical protein QOH89_3108 [Pseudonocardiales bacterium]|nr:hypothetical protein [Pseudonocardiales bacterium]MDT4942768.1 hypothetical protein [Pseudonocardiales bacterium]
MGSDYSVQYVGETPSFPSMAAATSMMLVYKNGQSMSDSRVLRTLTDAGINPHSPSDVDRVAYPLSLNALTDPCRDPNDWAKALERGPLMVGTSNRVFLVAGINDESNGDSAHLKILDPAQGGETWMSFSEAKQRYELDPDLGYVIKLFQW